MEFICTKVQKKGGVGFILLMRIDMSFPQVFSGDFVGFDCRSNGSPITAFGDDDSLLGLIDNA